MDKNTTCLEQFKKTLIKEDITERTINGYLYDLKVFKHWAEDFYQQDIDLSQIAVNDIQAYREYLVKVKRYKK